MASPPGPAFQYKQFHPLNPKVKAKYTYLEFFLEYCFSLCAQCPLVSQRLVHGRFRCEDFFDLPHAGFSYKDSEFKSCTDLGPIRKREACQRVRGVIQYKELVTMALEELKGQTGHGEAMQRLAMAGRHFPCWARGLNGRDSVTRGLRLHPP